MKKQVRSPNPTLPVAIAGALLGAAAAAHADDTCTGCLGPTPAVFNRLSDTGATTGICNATAPDSFNNGVPYRVIHLRTTAVAQTAVLSLTSLEPAGSRFDPCLALYCSPFNPANPGANLIAINDDGLGYPNARIAGGVILQPNTVYDVVVSSYSTYPDATFGRFQLSSTGPASLTCCPGDFNGSGDASVQDIFDFLAAYFNPGACSTPGYAIGAGGSPYQSIAASGTRIATVSDCDDCALTISIGFTFNYLGNAYSAVSVCSNGFIQFGGGNEAQYVNAPIPDLSSPNNIVCPLWDDLNPFTGGDVYYRTQGAPGSRTLTISWENVNQFQNTDSNSFQVVLFEGSNNMEFRYGAITAETPPGDYSVGQEDAAGTSGASIAAASLGAGGTSRLLTPTLSPPASCGCPADFNNSGAITVQDIFDFLAAYFGGCN